MAWQLKNNRLYQRLRGSYLAVSVLIGLAIGAAIWLLNLFLQWALIVPLFCNSPDNFSVCASGGTYAWWLAAVPLLLLSLWLLVRRGVYRPLLVIMASLAALWGIWAWLGYLTWWQASLWQAVLLALSYGLFALLARIPNFGLSLVALVAAVILARLVSLSA